MFKKSLGSFAALAVVAGATLATPSKAEAYHYYHRPRYVAPVYPAYRSYYPPVVYSRPVYYSTPVVYSPAPVVYSRPVYYTTPVYYNRYYYPSYYPSYFSVGFGYGGYRNSGGFSIGWRH